MAAARNSHGTETVSLTLDRRTLRRVERLAAKRKCTVEQYLQSVIAQLDTPADPFRGMFRDSPEVIDRIVEDAMTARETHPLRRPRE